MMNKADENGRSRRMVKHSQVNTAPRRTGHWRIDRTLILGFGVVTLLATSARATTWYVDSAATGANDGTSWASAWTSLSSASGSSVLAGDTVYISGGPSGSSRTYSSSWSPKSGSSTARITYKIGQDASHNGSAVFTASARFPASTPSYCTISGDAGDGQQHFKCTAATGVLSGGSSANNLRVSYVNFGSVNPGSGQAMYVSSATGFEFDHNYLNTYGATADAGLRVDQFSGSTYDQNLIHDNEVYTPTTASNPAIGADGMQMAGSGYSIYNNKVVSYRASYSGGQHSDGWQTSGGSYVKIYNNLFWGFGDIGLYGGCWGNAVSGGSHTFSHVRIYNNIVDSGFNNAAGAIDVSADLGSGSTFSDILIYNNIGRVGPNSAGAPAVFQFATGDGQGTFSGDACYNNIAISPSTWTAVDTRSFSIPTGNNVHLTDAQAAAQFVSFTPGATNNNFHLLAAATSLIGKGANFYSVFTTDKDGNPRPSSGAWDIGPYQYGAAQTNPVVSVSPTSVSFGTITTGASVTNSFTVQNAGSGTLSGSATVSAPFYIVSGGSYSLGAGQSQTVSVRYSPSVAGANSANVTLTGGGGATVAVSGTARALSSISVGPSNPSLTPGASQQFSALGTYSDGTTQTLTTSASWSSSAPSVATVSAGGLASGISAGTTTISAAVGGISGSTTLMVQLAPLTITTASLPNGMPNTAYTAALTATGGASPYRWSIVGGALAPGLTLTASGTITGTPTATGTFNFTVQVADGSVPAHTATAALSLVVSSTVSIWPNTAAPTLADEGSSSTNPVELGVKFRADMAGKITGIRFYKSSANTGPHVANLWNTNGTLLASATFSGETASGWQQVLFATPVAISSNTVYIASYHTTNGHYSEDDNFFASSGVDNGLLHALSNGAAGGNGVYVYSASSAFPSQTWSAANYWVDVSFQPASAVVAPQPPAAPTHFRIVSSN